MSRKLLAALGLSIALLGIILLAWPGASRSRLEPSLALPDGSVVRVVAVTYGTNHIVGPALGRLAARVPPVVRSALERILGPNATRHSVSRSPTPTLVVWVSQGTNSAVQAVSNGHVEAMLADANGFVSGESVSLPSGVPWWSQDPVPLHFRAFPRRNRAMTLRFFHPDSDGKVVACGHLPVVNPDRSTYAEWTPEPLPIIKRTGDVELILERLSTGHGQDTTHKAAPTGGKVIEFSAREREGDGQNKTVCLMRLRSLTDTNQIWRVVGVEVSDATGNKLNNHSMGWGGAREAYFTFEPGLWPDEAAWKLACETKRIEGFAPGEMFSFRNVPLGSFGTTNYLGLTTNIAGVSVSLDSVCRREPLTNSAWSSRELSQVHFTVSGLTNGVHLDLISTQSDIGEKLECVSWSSSTGTRQYYFRNVPAAARAADFAFAVQQSRTVEFVVKPEVGVARLEY